MKYTWFCHRVVSISIPSNDLTVPTYFSTMEVVVHQIAADEVGSALKACRICFEEESPNENLKEVLVSPCACRGSSAQVHLCCLQQWHLTGTRPAPLRCPTCKQAYFGSVAVVLARLNLNRAEKDALPYLSQILLSVRCYSLL